MNSADTQYVISLEQFEGSLDLLYQLVEKRKLQINTITLAKVTADYIAHIQKMEDTPAEEIAQFVHIASILILIKSKSLLPILEYTKEEEGDIVILQERMKLFEYIRSQAVPVFDIWRRQAYTIRPGKQMRQVIFSPDPSCTIKGIHKNAQAIITNLSFLKGPPKKQVGKVMSMGEMIETVLATVTDRLKLSFKDVSSGKNKTEKILSFLAVLELMKKDLLTAYQDKEFDDILLIKEEQSV